jgi:PAS domain S-box-containing protein/putative nucleotidyltransferase with HDIG domain
MSKPDMVGEETALSPGKGDAGAGHAARREGAQEGGGPEPAIFDHLPDGICILDEFGLVRYFNLAFARIVRRPAPEIIGRNHVELFYHLVDDPAECPIVRQERSHQRTSGLVRIEERWYQVLANPLFDNRGDPAGAVHVFSDVTSLKQTEEALHRTNRALRTLNLSNQILVRSVDEASLLEDICRTVVDKGGFLLAWIGLTGEAGTEGLREIARAGDNGVDLADLVGVPDEPGGPESLAASAMKTRRPAILRSFEPSLGFRLGASSAASSPAAASLILPLTTNGSTLGVMAVCAREHDAFAEREVEVLTELAADLAYGLAAIRTRRKHDEAVRDLRISEEKYATLVEKGNDGIVVVQDEKLSFVNSRAAEFLGRPVSDLIGASVADFIAPDHVELVLARSRARLAGKHADASYELDLVTGSGERRPVELGASIIHFQGRPATMAFLHDITERKKKDQALLESDKRLREAYLRLRDVLDGTIGAIATMAELRDPYTSGHQRRVARLACAIANEMGLPEDRLAGLATAGLLHDIGKIRVPSDILTKPRRLNPIEYEMIKTHSQAGYQILKSIPFPWPIADMIVQHHERMDGSGYPAGLAGEAILLEARILGVADVLEAMASHRPYRAALGVDAGLEEISKNSGKLFDPAVVAACLRIFSRGFRLDEEPV